MLKIKKFSDPNFTADGQRRAFVDFIQLKTLWFNTGTLCNLSCENCYIESTPKNDRLSYITLQDVALYLDEIKENKMQTQEVGFTGGEPFMNPEIIPILKECLEREFKVLVLTNAMRPMEKCAEDLIKLNKKHKENLTIRVSIDHYNPVYHEQERGKNTWNPTIKGLKWLSDNDFTIDVAGRTRWEKENSNDNNLRDGYAELFKKHDIKLDAYNEKKLVLFPEMDMQKDVPEITEKCWPILDVSSKDIMCSHSRMVVKNKNDKHPNVQACTLLAYEKEFNMGKTLLESAKKTLLNHPHCAKFCVLGGGACSVKES